MLNKFKVGHCTNEDMGSGVTVILAEDGAVGGVSVRGSAPATRETDLLSSGNAVEKINAVFLSGGSAFGLESATGIMKYLSEKSIGYATAARPVPIVCGACIYDLEYVSSDYPTAEMGYQACVNAREDNFKGGMIGAGYGATVGKVLGAKSAAKSALGVVKEKIGAIEIVCLAVVNAFGNVYDYTNGKLLKGAKVAGINVDINKAIRTAGVKLKAGTNTTICAILTNAKLTKAQANKLADMAHDGLAMTIRPVHTMVDGDAVFTLASGEVECDFLRLSCLIGEIMAGAVMNAVSVKSKFFN